MKFQVTTGYRPPQEPGVPNSVALVPWAVSQVNSTTCLDFLFLPGRKGTVIVSCVIALRFAWDIWQKAGILGDSRFLIWIVLISLLGLHKVKVMCLLAFRLSMKEVCYRQIAEKYSSTLETLEMGSMGVSLWKAKRRWNLITLPCPCLIRTQKNQGLKE